MRVAEIFETMEYGPAPESAKPAQEWLDAHERRFGMMIDGAWTEPEESRLFDSVNPSNGKPLARVTQATSAEVDAPSKRRNAWWPANDAGTLNGRRYQPMPR